MAVEFNYNNVVTADMYLKERGVDLHNELATIFTSDLGENAVEQFIHQLEEYILDYFSSVYDFDGDIHSKNDFQKKQFAKAVIYEIDFVLAHPDCLTENGISNAGVGIDYDKLNQYGFHPMVKNMMLKGGMANLRGC